MSRRSIGLELWMVGGGPLRDELERLAAELGSGEAVRFAGEIAAVGDCLG